MYVLLFITIHLQLRLENNIVKSPCTYICTHMGSIHFSYSILFPIVEAQTAITSSFIFFTTSCTNYVPISVVSATSTISGPGAKHSALSAISIGSSVASSASSSSQRESYSSLSLCSIKAAIFLAA